jgi:diguanylate cyclase (GGDEF)-like protein/PAS domain S-box-containing protein
MPDARTPETVGRGRADKLLEYLLETVSIIDRDGKITYCTDDAGVLGYGAGEAAGRSALAMVHPEDARRVSSEVSRCMSEPDTIVSGEFRLRDVNGHSQWVEAVAYNRFADPDLQGMVLATRNITPRVQAQAAVRRGNDRFRALVAYAADIVMIVDAEGRFEYVSPAVGSVFGRDPEELMELDSIEQLVRREDREEFGRAWRAAISRPGVNIETTFRSRHRNGSVRHLETTITNLFEDPAVEGIVVNLTDVTERDAFEQALMHQALHDPLTGLANRTLLVDRLREAFTELDTPGVLLLDVGGMESVNENLGYAYGDELLMELASRLRHEAAPTDTVARLAGDQFVVVRRGATAAALYELADQLLHAFDEPVPLADRQVRAAASIGIAIADIDDSPNSVLRKAGIALTLAKGLGRSRCEVFHK